MVSYQLSVVNKQYGSLVWDVQSMFRAVGGRGRVSGHRLNVQVRGIVADAEAIFHPRRQVVVSGWGPSLCDGAKARRSTHWPRCFVVPARVDQALQGDLFCD